jgi:hypothetical protein
MTAPDQMIRHDFADQLGAPGPAQGQSTFTSQMLARHGAGSFRISHGQPAALRAAAPPRKLSGSAAPKLPIVPSTTAPVGSREWAACLIAEFGEKKGAEFFARELTYQQALDESAAEHIAKFGPPPKTQPASPPAPQLTASAPPATEPRRGFARRIKFAKGSFSMKEARLELRAKAEAEAAERTQRREFRAKRAADAAEADRLEREKRRGYGGLTSVYQQKFAAKAQARGVPTPAA